MTRKWWRKTEPLYRRFSHLGRDSAEAEEMFLGETFGSFVSPTNRYAVGKRNMDATIMMWREDIGAGLLFKFELLEDKSLPQWLLRKILPKTLAGENCLLEKG